MANWSPSQDEAAIWDFFTGKGLDSAAVSGILGNLEQESDFNPEAVQQGGPGRGIAQWSQGGRWQPNLMTGNNSQDLMNQLNYMWSELNGPYSGVLGELQGANNVQTAAQDFGQGYEMYGTAGNRYSDAGQIYNFMTSHGAPTSQSGGTSALSALLGGVNSAAQAGVNVQDQALSQQQALGGAQQQITDQQLLQQLQDTMAALGLSGQSLNIQGLGLEQQGGFEKGQYNLGINQDLLAWTGIGEALQNLQAQYGFQQQQFGLQGKENLQGFQQGWHNAQIGDAAAGTYNTGSHAYDLKTNLEAYQNAQQALGIEKGQAAQSYKYGTEQEQNALKQLGLTKEGQTQNYAYQQEQLANAIKQLGIQRQQLGLQGTEAQQQYTSGTQAAGNQYADLLNSILLQQGQLTTGAYGNIGNILQELMSSGMFTGG